VRPPAAELIEVVSGSLDVLNIRCNDILSEEITPIGNWDLVTELYQKAQPGQPAVGSKKVKLTQHCEITLALDLHRRHNQQKLTNTKIKIGVSKACCEWCCGYLNLASAYTQYSILIRASHGKQPDSWMMLPQSPNRVVRQMRQLIEGKVDSLYGQFTTVGDQTQINCHRPRKGWMWKAVGELSF
jgi:OTT_1508-like deaminase